MNEKKVNENKKEELPTLSRFTKEQVDEIYKLFEEGRTPTEISKIFHEKYKCKPPSLQRLHYYRRLHNSKNEEPKKIEKEKVKDQVVTIGDILESNEEKDNLEDYKATNEDINELKEKMLSFSSNEKVLEKNNGKLLGIDLNLVIIGAVVIVIIIVIFLWFRKRSQEMEKEKVDLEKPESFEKTIGKRGLKVKWV